MPNKRLVPAPTDMGTWVKRCHLAARVAMDDVLRPHDLGATQWYVLYQLVAEGPTPQGELQKNLRVERPTMSGVVGVLVRKGLIEQVSDPADQRRKVLRMTAAGNRLWDDLPDLTHIHEVAFDGIDAADLATAVKVLRTATERLESRSLQGD